MATRDYESAPVSAEIGMVGIIRGLATDLEQLRAGKITVQDAIARALLAKQIFNGVRIYMNATKMLTEQAKAIDATSTDLTVAPATQQEEVSG